MTDDERAALQGRIAGEIRRAMMTVSTSGITGWPLSTSALADLMIGACGNASPAGWAQVVAVIILDDRMRDGLAQVMQAAVMLDELARATELATRD